MSGPAIPDEHGATLLIESTRRIDVHQLGDESMIGRDRRCAVVIDHPTVSRQHARIFRDARGWQLQDLGSQNGSRLGQASAGAASPLADISELRIGRVRGWFFAGAVPTGWAPPGAPSLAGKLIRCHCGHIGWAPIVAGQSQLRCSACGRALSLANPSPARESVPAPAIETADCAACHTAIAAGESMHACSECGATMHAGCWDENRGCATYGCGQVGVLDQVADDAAMTVSATPSQFETAEPSASEGQWSTFTNVALSDSFKQSLMAVIAFGGAGLPLFGVPPVGYAAYQLVGVDPALEGRRRYAWAAISLAAGVVGFAASSRWWLGAH